MSSNDIHDLFTANAPEEPSTQGWADAVRGRRRRRRVVTGVASGGLAVALAVPLGATLLNRPAQIASPAKASTLTAAEVCADARTQAEAFATLGGEALQEGAVRAWLCGDEQTEEGSAFGTAGPTYPITQGVDEAIAWYLDAPEADPMAACTMEYILTYTVAFEYEDGSIAPVQGQLHGCRTVTDGATIRSGGDELYALLQDLWADNRGEDFVAEVEPCTMTATMGEVADPADATSAALCQADAEGNRVASRLTAEQASAVGLSVSETATTAPDAITYPDRVTTLQLFDAAGSLLSLDALDDGSFLFYDGDAARVWTPGAELRAELEEAAALPLP